MILGLRTVIYPVTDLAKAKAWYSAVLERQPYFDEPYYVGYAVGGFELGLDPNGIPAQAQGGPLAYWGVANADAAVERLLGLGAGLHAGVEDVGDGIRHAVLVDPFGNSFGLIENPHFTPESVQ